MFHSAPLSLASFVPSFWFKPFSLPTISYTMAIESRATQIAAIGYTFVILSTIATCLRVYCRAFVIKAFALDDWFAVIAQVCAIDSAIVASLTIPSSCLLFSSRTKLLVFTMVPVVILRISSQKISSRPCRYAVDQILFSDAIANISPFRCGGPANLHTSYPTWLSKPVLPSSCFESVSREHTDGSFTSPPA